MIQAPIQSPPHTTRDPLVGRDMLCFSHDWTGDPLSKTHLMRLLAKDNRVLWVNSIGYRAPNLGSKQDLGRIARKLKLATEPVREVEPNIFVLNPLVAPPYKNRLISSLNRMLLRCQVRTAMKRLGFRRPINWVFNPMAADVAGQFGESQVVYYCVDEYTAFTGVASSHLNALEEKLLRTADFVVVSSNRLLESKRRHNSSIALIRHGVDFEHFRTALDEGTETPASIVNLPRPIIGFFGLVADWVDVSMFARLAMEFPNGSIVIVGKATTDVSELEKLPNVHLTGRKPYSELPAYCKGFDVAINPFVINELTLNANPLKVREYLAAGLPVVSTAIPEVETLGGCLIGRTSDEFVERVKEALRLQGPNRERSETMRCESWAARVNELKKVLAPTLRINDQATQ